MRPLTLVSAGRALAGITSIQALISRMEKTVKELLSCSMCTVYTHDRENQLLFTLDAAGRELRIKISDQTVAGAVVLSARPQRIENVYENTRFKALAASNLPRRSSLSALKGTMSAATMRCNMLCCPVMKGATVLGVIQCIRDKDSEAGLFSLKEEEWLVDFTHQVAMQVNPQLLV